jgi:hypothetical protein
MSSWTTSQRQIDDANSRFILAFEAVEEKQLWIEAVKLLLIQNKKKDVELTLSAVPTPMPQA